MAAAAKRGGLAAEDLVRDDCGDPRGVGLKRKGCLTGDELRDSVGVVGRGA